jgi:hypothetical protein
MKKLLLLTLVLSALLSCRAKVIKGEGCVDTVVKDSDMCRCLVVLPKSSTDEKSYWFECPSNTEVGDTLVFVWK